jgi:hypothetical protein
VPAARRATPQSVESHAVDRASHALLSRDELRYRRTRSLRLRPDDRRRRLCLRESCGQNRGVTQAQLTTSAPPANAKLTTQPRTGAGRRRPARTSLISCLRLRAYCTWSQRETAF